MSANAYELLKSEIVSGKRKPGEIFEEKRFAAQLGVSRTPVREAVLRLAREGLLVVMPRRGTVISNISMENIRQLYEARVMLEPQILRIAAKRADKIHWPAGKPFLKLRPRRPMRRLHRCRSPMRMRRNTPMMLMPPSICFWLIALATAIFYSRWRS